MTVNLRFGYPPVPGRPRPGGPARLVFAGEAIVDVVMRVPLLPERGGDMLAESSAITAGGGFNVMAAAARHGLPVVYAGGHGTGPWGDLIRAALAAEGISVLRPPDANRDTGFDVALVDAEGERTFVTQLGAETMRDPGGWDPVPAGPGDAVYVSGYGLAAPDAGPALGRWAASLPPGVLLFFDPGPLVAQIPAAVLDPVLARCDWLSCNLRESAALSGLLLARSGIAETDQGAHSAMRLHDRAPQADIIVRAGAGRLSGGPAHAGRPGPRARPAGDRRRHDRRGRRPLGRVPRGPGR